MAEGGRTMPTKTTIRFPLPQALSHRSITHPAVSSSIANVKRSRSALASERDLIFSSLGAENAALGMARSRIWLGPFHNARFPPLNC